MSKFSDIITDLNLPDDGTETNTSYIVSPKNSNEFSRIFNNIAINRDFDLTGTSKATDTLSDFRYTDGIYEVHLYANYDKDFYQITVEEK